MSPTSYQTALPRDVVAGKIRAPAFIGAGKDKALPALVPLKKVNIWKPDGNVNLFNVFFRYSTTWENKGLLRKIFRLKYPA